MITCAVKKKGWIFLTRQMNYNRNKRKKFKLKQTFYSRLARAFPTIGALASMLHFFLPYEAHASCSHHIQNDPKIMLENLKDWHIEFELYSVNVFILSIFLISANS